MQSPDDCPLEPKALEGSEQGQVRQTPSDAESSASLCTSAELNLGDRVLGKVEKSDFIALLGKRGHNGLMPLKTVCLNLGGFGEEFYSSGSRVELLTRMRVCTGLALF